MQATSNPTSMMALAVASGGAAIILASVQPRKLQPLRWTIAIVNHSPSFAIRPNQCSATHVQLQASNAWVALKIFLFS
jgi:hypothetical protein